jgi:hypothetical protein
MRQHQRVVPPLQAELPADLLEMLSGLRRRQCNGLGAPEKRGTSFA